MSSSFQHTLLWLVATLLAMFISLQWMSGSWSGAEFIPSSNDAFYHARRILDALNSPMEISQFETTMHVPEGAWITWPWGYGAMMAVLTNGLYAITPAASRVDSLMWIPVLWLGVNLALLLAIGRSLQLKTIYLAVLLCCYAASPLTLTIHAIGNVDSHFMEQSLVFMTLWRSLEFFNDPASAGKSILLGLVLALAPVIHNGLFLLQTPVVFCFILLIARGTKIPLRIIACFAATLLAVTLLILLPSTAARTGLFNYSVLSWFHAWCAVSTVLVVAGFHHYSGHHFRWWILAGLIVISITWPATELYRGLRFVVGGEHHEFINESRSPIYIAQGLLQHYQIVLQFYSILLLALPLVIWRCIRALSRRPVNEMVLAIFCLCGLFLLVQQMRFHYFGSFALYLPLLVYLNHRSNGWQVQRKLRMVGSGALILMCFLPGIAVIRADIPLANDPSYRALTHLILDLRQFCQQDPGVVLVDKNRARYVHYFTDCTIIANNMIQSPRHIEKRKELEQLLQLTPLQLQQAKVDWKYLLIQDNQHYGPALRQVLKNPEHAVFLELATVKLTVGNNNPTVGMGLYKRQQGNQDSLD